MTEGDIALTQLPQAQGGSKPRPVVLLRKLPPYGDWLVCGVSTQLHQQVPSFDEIVDSSQADFATSGLKAASLIRLGFLAVLPVNRILGVIGSISHARLQRLQERLSNFLAPQKP